jgi:hypothetical protein
MFGLGRDDDDMLLWLLGVLLRASCRVGPVTKQGEVGDGLERGRCERSHGIRQKGGSMCACELDEAKAYCHQGAGYCFQKKIRSIAETQNLMFAFRAPFSNVWVDI